MNEDEWVAWRAEGVGASDVARAMGAYGWTPARVVADKLDPAPISDYQQRLFDKGHAAEARILAAVADEHGGVIAGQQSAWVHPTNPHRRCTLDGVLLADEWSSLLDGVAVEAKWTKSSNPGWVHYRTQVQYQLAVTGLAGGIIGCQYLDADPVTEVVEADDIFGRRLLVLADDLWAAIVAAREARAGEFASD